jgi:CheY-like chemotaxis protein
MGTILRLVPKPSRPSIVVCDGDATFRQVFGSYARAQGCDVREAGDGAAALDAMEESAPHGLLIELAMPGQIDGKQVLRRVRCDRRLAEVRVVSTVEPDAEAESATRDGAHEVMHKPLPPAAALRGLLGPGTERPTEPICVFVVEDHEDTRELMLESLAASGIHAFGLASGSDALRALRGVRPDVILTDFSLTDLDGAELARRARARAPGIPVIALTGRADVARAGSGFDRAFLKPIDLDEVIAAVREIAAHANRA